MNELEQLRQNKIEKMLITNEQRYRRLQSKIKRTNQKYNTEFFIFQAKSNSIIKREMKQSRISLIILLIYIILPLITSKCSCVHSQFSRNSTRHFLHDLSDHRLLAASQVGKLRVFVDYGQVSVGTDVEINTIKRIINITANYFYNVLNVTRLPRLYYPSNVSLTCNTLTVDPVYVTQGTIGDIGIIAGNQINSNAVYVAKSLACAYLESNKRPIWGIMIWNNLHLKYDQVGFQEMVYVANHQLSHVLGFSSSMYETYPKGNPLVMGPLGDYFLNSSRIQQQIKSFFGCTNSLGLPVEDQDGTLIASHWQRKVVGNQYMIASGRKGSYMSRFTLALFQSTGWYQNVNYTYAEPTTWGKGKGCNFLNIDLCDSVEFCQDSSFNCDWEATAIGKCTVDPFTGSCNVYKYYTNTICVDENYQLKNLNAKLNALQKGGSSSRCYNSDFRQEGLNKTVLNQRCYTTVCSSTGQFLYVMVGSSILICRTPGQIVNPPPGLNGTLVCPKNFDNVCKNKKTCPYHCNKNGACIDGKCLCTSSTDLSSSCIDVSIYIAPVNKTGGNLYIEGDNSANHLNLNSNIEELNKKKLLSERAQYSINSKCMRGSILDTIFGDCIRCKDLYNCENCNENGCILCDDMTLPKAGKC